MRKSSSSHQRPARAAHCGVEQGGDHAAVDDRPARCVEAVLRRRVPLDHRAPVRLLDAAVAERVPDVRIGRRVLAPRRARAAHRGPGTPRKAERLDAVRLDDPRAAVSRLGHPQRRLGDEGRSISGTSSSPAARPHDRRVGESGTDRVDPDPALREPRRGRAHPADDRVLRGGVRGVERHAVSPASEAVATIEPPSGISRRAARASRRRRRRGWRRRSAGTRASGSSARRGSRSRSRR